MVPSLNPPVAYCYHTARHIWDMAIPVVVYPLPTLASGGESDLPACSPPASFSVHLTSSAVPPAGSVHKSRGNNVVRMWVQLERYVCCVCECYKGDIVLMDVIWCRLCVSMI